MHNSGNSVCVNSARECGARASVHHSRVGLSHNGSERSCDHLRNCMWDYVKGSRLGLRQNGCGCAIHVVVWKASGPQYHLGEFDFDGDFCIDPPASG